MYLGNIAVNNQHFVNAVKMGKVSHADKMRMQTLHEQGCGAKAIVRAYPYKGWKLSLSRTAKQFMPAGFIFHQDGAPAHTARVTQEWLHANRPEIIEQDRWPPNSPDLNPLDYHVWGAMMERYHKLQL